MPALSRGTYTSTRYEVTQTTYWCEVLKCHIQAQPLYHGWYHQGWRKVGALQSIIWRQTPNTAAWWFTIYQTAVAGHTQANWTCWKKNSMLAELRQRFWIPRAGQLIKSMLSKCVDCRMYFAYPDRVIWDLPAFTYVGVDYFGPIEVKRGCTVQKRYGVIFTCSSSRAVHLEVSHSLTTDSCIQAIRRFLARRGPVIRIRSDNGTNLVGAEAEMKRKIASWNQTKIGRYLQQHHIEWTFFAPASSHFGGFWERLIRFVRLIMYSLLRDQSISLDDEALNTLMCEVEQGLNIRCSCIWWSVWSANIDTKSPAVVA